jgi:ParB-like nuclease domain
MVENYKIDRGVKLLASQVEHNPWNPNKTTDRQQEAIGESLSMYGQVLEILVRPHPQKEGIYQVIDGAHRLDNLSDIVYANVIYGLPDADAKKLTIVMNETRGSADKLELAELLNSIQTDLGDLLGVGLPYSTVELSELTSLSNIDWGSFDTPNPEEEIDDTAGESSGGSVDGFQSVFMKLSPETMDRLSQAKDLVGDTVDLSKDPAISWGEVIDNILNDFLGA